MFSRRVSLHLCSETKESSKFPLDLWPFILIAFEFLKWNSIIRQPFLRFVSMVFHFWDESRVATESALSLSLELKLVSNLKLQLSGICSDPLWCLNNNSQQLKSTFFLTIIVSGRRSAIHLIDLMDRWIKSELGTRSQKGCSRPTRAMFECV